MFGTEKKSLSETNQYNIYRNVTDKHNRETADTRSLCKVVWHLRYW